MTINTMKRLYEFYQTRIEELSFLSSKLKKSIHFIGSLRLFLLVATIATCYLMPTSSLVSYSVVVIAYAIPFIGLMVYHNKLFNKSAETEILLELNRNELKALDGDYSAFDGAIEERDPSHSYAVDLDLFGEHSLFQAINRTVTAEGRNQLIKWLKQPADSKAEIEERQAAIRELASHPELFQRFYQIGKSKTQEQNDKQTTRHFLNELTKTSHSFHHQIWKIWMIVVPSIWTVLIFLSILGIIPDKIVGIYLMIALVVAFWKSKEIQSLYQSADKLEQMLLTYADLIRHTEEVSFHSNRMQSLQLAFIHEKQKASGVMKELSRHIGALNQRFSAAGLIFNILFLRDTRHAIALENWKEKHGQAVAHWLNTLAEIDSFYSLGQFAFNHPDYTFPQMADSYFEMRGKNVGHPLLRREVCVNNDINIPKSPYFLIITGANMAGKSTYLRTVGINFVMACLGLPVCADELTLYPTHLVTSLCTSDSLAGNESYFFAELKRLKMIIDRLRSGEKLFIILDEILKGTNSIDKQKGSLALMKQLVAEQACGIIATHDLVLGSLEDEFPNKVKNYCFEADIKNEELSFTYKQREGIAQNMNASFLIEKLLRKT